MTEYFLVTIKFGAKAKRVYVATELSKLVSQQGEPFVATESSRAWGFPCRDIGVRHYVVTRLCTRDRDAL